MSSTSLPAQRLSSRVAIVSGSSRGIGATIALDLARRGAKVLIMYTSEYSLPKVEELIKEIDSLNHGSTASCVCADLKTMESPAQVVAEALKTDADHWIDILANNAAIELNKPLESITADDFASIYNLNERAPTFLTKAVLPHLRRQGRIVNISSVGARAGFANLPMCCSSKATLEGLTRCWAAKLGKDGTTVNAVASGPVESNILADIPEDIVDM